VLRNFDENSAKDTIEEVRIEGHTSSEWTRGSTDYQAYFKNMELSQGRTRSVLDYAFGLLETSEERDWVRINMAAVGYSSSRFVLDDHGREDRDASRRVIFRVVTNSETQISRILDGETTL